MDVLEKSQCELRSRGGLLDERARWAVGWGLPYGREVKRARADTKEYLQERCGLRLGSAV